ncbi:adenosine deaminase [Nocardioides insulae]|uniref:adenosine deaminase n=1 Tax=Nocardioides insulae TaxID=394734 RepID=UPI00048EE003|nr:adenosine deaminase [Nocardioides insulae]
MEPTVTHDTVHQAPKVVLHDHLDGGLRPATVRELAGQIGHDLPADTAEALEQWFFQAADSGSLERYLETFGHTVAVMQSAEALRRVAREAVEDHAADGVVYAEIRYAPELHVEGGLTLDQVVAAVQQGLDEGTAAVSAAGGRIVVRQLLTAMRHAARALEIAELAVAWRDRGVAGFDIAGPEAGYPPTRFLDSFEFLRSHNAHFTIHAGEAFGLPSIHEAVQYCGADRLGHGVRLVDDITQEADGTLRLGRLAAYVKDARIPLELCPTSNLQTGAALAIAEHPIGLLTRARFRVTVNTDNRLMSRTSMTQEMWALVQAFGYGLDTLEWFTVNAMKSAFVPYDERYATIREVIRPGYAALR